MLGLLVVLLELLIGDEGLRFLLDFPDGVETNDYKDEINDRVDHTMVNHINVFFQVGHETIKANVVKQDHEESIERADRMIRLLFVDVDLVVAHHKERLGKLDVVNKTDELVFAVSEDTSPVDNRKYGEDPLSEEGDNRHGHQVDADFQMVALHVLQLLGELCLFLHVASLFFASPIPHFLTNIVDSVLAERIIILEKIDGVLAIVFSVTAAVASSSGTTFIGIL